MRQLIHTETFIMYKFNRKVMEKVLCNGYFVWGKNSFDGFKRTLQTRVFLQGQYLSCKRAASL